MNYRVVVWGTGEVGRHSIRALANRTSDFTLVGALVYDPNKDGRDVGEIAGIDPIGVKATTDKNAILAMDADCVLHHALGEPDPEGTIDDICAMLAAGKNVVTTALIALTYPQVLGPETYSRIETACKEGRTTLHGTGIAPGFLNDVLPVTLSGLFRKIDFIDVAEAANYTLYPSAQMISLCGFGLAPDDPTVPLANPDVIKTIYGAGVQMVADSLGVELDSIEAGRDVLPAPYTFEVSSGIIEEGTAAAMHIWAAGVVDGRQVIRAGAYTRMREELAPDWPQGEGWHLSIDGDPTFRMHAEIGLKEGDDYTDKENLGTAMHSIHAVPLVTAAEPGIKTVVELGHIIGRGLYAQ